MPGIISWQLYKAQLTAPGATTDQAYPLLIKNLVGPGIRGFILAAIAGAVISTLGSLLNSVATLLTMDIYKRHINKNADQKTIVRLGRWATLVFVVAVCLIAPQLGNPKFKGIFNYIQEFQGFISPGILAAFVFGLFVKKTPRAAGVVSLLLNVPIYGLLMWKFASIAFLNRMAITFVVLDRRAGGHDRAQAAQGAGDDAGPAGLRHDAGPGRQVAGAADRRGHARPLHHLLVKGRVRLRSRWPGSASRRRRPAGRRPRRPGRGKTIRTIASSAVVPIPVLTRARTSQKLRKRIAASAKKANRTLRFCLMAFCGLVQTRSGRARSIIMLTAVRSKVAGRATASGPAR